MRLPFITRLKRLFRLSRPAIDADRKIILDDDGNIIGFSVPHFHVVADRFDLRATEAARDLVPTGNAQAIEAARTAIEAAAKAPDAVVRPISPIQSNPAPHKLTVVLNADGHISGFELAGYGYASKSAVIGDIVKTTAAPDPDWNEIIRIANSLLRLAGAK